MNDKKKLYSSPRWNDIPDGKVIGRDKLTPEEKARDEEISRLFYENVISKLKSKKDEEDD